MCEKHILIENYFVLEWYYLTEVIIFKQIIYKCMSIEVYFFKTGYRSPGLK